MSGADDDAAAKRRMRLARAREFARRAATAPSSAASESAASPAPATSADGPTSDDVDDAAAKRRMRLARAREFARRADSVPSTAAGDNVDAAKADPPPAPAPTAAAAALAPPPKPTRHHTSGSGADTTAAAVAAAAARVGVAVAEGAKSKGKEEEEEEEQDGDKLLEAYMNTVNAEASRDVQATIAKAKRVEAAGASSVASLVIGEGEDEEVDEASARLRCYICKKHGHTKKDCPMKRCSFCGEIGHQRADCPAYDAELAKQRIEEKERKRKRQYENKKKRKREEWDSEMRRRTGIHGYEALYQVLGLPPRRLATEAQIKRAYHAKSLQWHPDKHPEDPETAQQKFLEIKATYDLLLEGMRTGGVGMGGSVYLAGELTAADPAMSAAAAKSVELNTRAETIARASTQRTQTAAAAAALAFDFSDNED